MVIQNFSVLSLFVLLYVRCLTGPIITYRVTVGSVYVIGLFYNFPYILLVVVWDSGNNFRYFKQNFVSGLHLVFCDSQR